VGPSGVRRAEWQVRCASRPLELEPSGDGFDGTALPTAGSPTPVEPPNDKRDGRGRPDHQQDVDDDPSRVRGANLVVQFVAWPPKTPGDKFDGAALFPGLPAPEATSPLRAERREHRTIEMIAAVIGTIVAASQGGWRRPWGLLHQRRVDL
jgi:hypothetical protein